MDTTLFSAIDFLFSMSLDSCSFVGETLVVAKVKEKLPPYSTFGAGAKWLYERQSLTTVFQDGDLS